MSNLSDTLLQQLTSRDFGLQEWKLLLQRLLDYGVLCRDDSQVEAEFYDQFVRIEPLIDDYLSLIGVRFQHDKNFHYVRLIPPGARLAGVDDENDEPYNGGFRQRLSQHEVAMVLVLRAEYDKALREGAIDEQGCTAISLEAITLSMKNLLKRALPEQMVERRQVFKKLRQLRLIHFVNEADLEQSESWVKIRPLIINLVSNEWLEAIRQDAKLGSDIVSQSQTDGEDVSVSDASSSIDEVTLNNDAESLSAEESGEISQPEVSVTDTRESVPLVVASEPEIALAEKNTPVRNTAVKEALNTAKAKPASAKASVKKSPAAKEPATKATPVKPVAAKAASSAAPVVKKPVAKKASANAVAAGAKTAKVAVKTGNTEKPVAAKKSAVTSKPVRSPAKKVAAKKSTAKSTPNDA